MVVYALCRYTTTNFLHLNVGNNMFGDVSIILRPQSVHPLALLEPVDSGNWEDWCNRTGPVGKQCHHFPFSVNCSAWDRVQGTVDHMEHILLANAVMWNSPVCANTTGGILPRLFSMLYGETRQDRTLTDPAQMMTFIEANLAGTVLYPDGVKLIVGTMQTLFGSVLGGQLRRWCVQNGWALLWAVGPSDDPAWWAAGHGVMDTRAVDPRAAATLNLTISTAGASQFDALWNTVASARAGGTAGAIQWNSSVWAEIPAELVVSSGLWPGQCADIDTCVAVHTNGGDCVCYSQSA
jgi:hypothetical protein